MNMKTQLTPDNYWTLPKLRAFKVSYLSCTDTQPSRIKIEDLYYDKERAAKGQKKAKIISYNHSFNDTLYGAIDWMVNNGFNVVSTASAPDHYLILCDNWGEDFKVLV